MPMSVDPMPPVGSLPRVVAALADDFLAGA
jgi:hypothetical protein